MCDITKPMSESQRLDAWLDAHREDWHSVARYTVRYKGFYFSGESHIQRTLATGLTWDEAHKLETEEKARMTAQGIEGHISFDLERPEETRAEFKKVRAAREARENLHAAQADIALAA